MAALMGIATQISLGISEPSTAWPRVGDGADPGVGGHPQAGDTREFRDGLRGRLAAFRADHLVRNSIYLMLSSGIQAVLGFTFWIVMDRLFSPSDVGIASSLISASSLIAFFALLGLNTTLVRFLPSAPDSSALITAAFVMVAGCTVIGSVAYVLLTPIVAPHLAFISHQPALAIGFVLLCVAVAVNLLTDSIFIAARRAGWCIITDGVVGGLGKIVLGVLLVGTGAYGLYTASVGGVAAAALVAVAAIITVLHWRPSLRNPLRALKPLLRFTGANYVANAFNLLPIVIVPLIVLDRLGPKSSAYYYMAYQMAGVLYAAVYAVENSFFAEGSQLGANWRAIRRRSRRFGITLFVPGSIVLALGGHWILLVFGAKYSEHATGSLELLAVAVIPIAIYNWAATVLRLTSRLRPLVWCNAFYSVSICGGAWVLSLHGLTALSASWLAGSSAAAAVTSVVAAYASRMPARHRKPKAGSAPSLAR